MKKQLCLLVAVLLSMSVLGGYRAFAEAYTQRVSLCDFQPDIKTLLYDDDFKDIGGASLGKISYLVGDGDIVVGGISLTKDEKPYSMITTDMGEVKNNIKTIKKTDATSDPMAFTAIYDGGKLVSISSASTYENGVSENTITVPENLSENAYMTVFVWNSTLKPYAKSKQMKFSTTKEKATLHLVADSIGVTYNTDTVDINAENGIAHRRNPVFVHS